MDKTDSRHVRSSPFGELSATARAVDAMIEVLIVGAGPAGSVAAMTLACAGVRVLMVDRARFPRAKLCADTVNPGTMEILQRLGAAGSVERDGLPLDGMIVTSGRRLRIRGAYPDGVFGRAITRRDLDVSLVNRAVEVGAWVEQGVAVRGPLVDGGRVRGVVLTGRDGRALRVPAAVTIAADGRRSTLAFALGLARHPSSPRRWAVGSYFDDVAGLSSCGEMHVRRGHYIGVAPLPGGIANLCVVTRPSSEFGDLAGLLRGAVARDPLLRERFAAARMLAPPVSIGPLAVDVSAAGCPGLLLAGDASGFVDPMTGDGLRFAVRAAELAADAARRMLETGAADGHLWLARARSREFQMKWRFNRTLRALVGSARGVGLAAHGARLAPSVLRRIIAIAGGVRFATRATVASD